MARQPEPSNHVRITTVAQVVAIIFGLTFIISNLFPPSLLQAEVTLGVTTAECVGVGVYLFRHWARSRKR